MDEIHIVREVAEIAAQARRRILDWAEKGRKGKVALAAFPGADVTGQKLYDVRSCLEDLHSIVFDLVDFRARLWVLLPQLPPQPPAPVSNEPQLLPQDILSYIDIHAEMLSKEYSVKETIAVDLFQHHRSLAPQQVALMRALWEREAFLDSRLAFEWDERWCLHDARLSQTELLPKPGANS